MSRHMGEIRVTPDRVRAVGGSISGVGRDITALKRDFKGLQGAVSAAPPQTGMSLVELAFQWSSGLERFGGSVTDLGALVTLVAWLYEFVDRSAIPRR